MLEVHFCGRLAKRDMAVALILLFINNSSVNTVERGHR